jgi:hypothetical protein
VSFNLKPNLPTVTLIVIDCINYDRAKLSLDHCRNSANFGAVKLLTHFDVNDNVAVKIEKINSISEYSNFVIRKLSDYFDTQHVLIAQWDGFIWNADLWDNRFLQYDYIGAPWPENILHPGAPKHFNVGNGGFSLRSKNLQEFLKNDKNLTMHHAEDVAICQLNRAYLEAKGFTFAPLDLARKFSWEYYDQQNAFGVHARMKLIKKH